MLSGWGLLTLDQNSTKSSFWRVCLIKRQKFSILLSMSKFSLKYLSEGPFVFETSSSGIVSLQFGNANFTSYDVTSIHILVTFISLSHGKIPSQIQS